MLDGLPAALVDTIEYFARFSGIGKKTAVRMVFSLLQKTPEYHSLFAKSIASMHQNIAYCQTCFHLCNANEQTCSICQSSKRNHRQICIVESSLDLLALERSSCFSGVYFVLGGVISPMNGIGPDDLRVKELQHRVAKNPPDEIIIALSSTMEGESTASFLSSLLAGSSCKISKIAKGMPLGNLLQYTDENTLHRAFEGRVTA